MAGDAYNPFATAQNQLDEVAGIMELDPTIHKLLRNPMREIHVTIPVRMDDGSTEIFQGFRVQYNGALGPTKGGIRFHPNETVDTVRALAAWMTWKTAIVGIPLGGAKGGVICDPRQLSPSELERLSRGYIRAIAHDIGSTKDIPAPDVNTNPQIMAWMLDEYNVIKGYHDPGFLTGKPLALGGSAGRGDATGRGLAIHTNLALEKMGIDPSTVTVAIQGFGNVGGYSAQILSEEYGATIVAVSDEHGAWYNPDGLDVGDLISYSMSNGNALKGYENHASNAKLISNDELLTLDVDVLAPCALEGQLTGKNAGDVKAKLIVEGANGPTTPEADDIFYERGIFVVPDFLCNSGGVTVSYFEMVQNSYGYYWDVPTVHDRLNKLMTTAFNAVYETAQERGIDSRMAAYVVAVTRVAEAVRLRGWV